MGVSCSPTEMEEIYRSIVREEVEETPTTEEFVSTDAKYNEIRSVSDLKRIKDNPERNYKSMNNIAVGAERFEPILSLVVCLMVKDIVLKA